MKELNAGEIFHWFDGWLDFASIESMYSHLCALCVPSFSPVVKLIVVLKWRA